MLNFSLAPPDWSKIFANTQKHFALHAKIFPKLFPPGILHSLSAYDIMLANKKSSLLFTPKSPPRSGYSGGFILGWLSSTLCPATCKCNTFRLCFLPILKSTILIGSGYHIRWFIKCTAIIIVNHFTYLIIINTDNSIHIVFSRL